MRVEKWDILMHRLLTEKKEKELKEKAFAGKKELDNDEDGVPKWADKDDSDSKVGSKGSKKKKGKGKIPPQLKMHIKKKKSKLDEAIERLEKILFEQHDLQEYGEDKHPDIEDDDDESETFPYDDEEESDEDDFEDEDDYEEEEEDKKETSDQADNEENKKEKEDEEEKEDVEDEEEPEEKTKTKKKKEKSFRYLEPTHKNISDWWKDQTSLEEAINRLEKILKEENKSIKEYGKDKHPDIEDDDDDFDADDLPSYGEEDFGDYDEESMRKFAQKSKDFADKYTEEDDYEEEEDYEDEDDFEDDDDMDLDDEEELEEYLTEAEVKKKQPRLGKVTRNPSGSKKKFHVYVKCGGRVKKISFGDPGLSIKRDSAARRKNFRARHKCDQPAGKDRCTARYWSCYQWRAGKKVEGEE